MSATAVPSVPRSNRAQMSAMYAGRPVPNPSVMPAPGLISFPHPPYPTLTAKPTALSKLSRILSDFSAVFVGCKAESNCLWFKFHSRDADREYERLIRLDELHRTGIVPKSANSMQASRYLCHLFQSDTPVFSMDKLKMMHIRTTFVNRNTDFGAVNTIRSLDCPELNSNALRLQFYSVYLASSQVSLKKNVKKKNYDIYDIKPNGNEEITSHSVYIPHTNPSLTETLKACHYSVKYDLIDKIHSLSLLNHIRIISNLADGVRPAQSIRADGSHANYPDSEYDITRHRCTVIGRVKRNLKSSKMNGTANESNVSEVASEKKKEDPPHDVSTDQHNDLLSDEPRKVTSLFVKGSLQMDGSICIRGSGQW